MRCGVHVRVSTDDQRDNGYSIDSQLRMIKKYCEKNNYDIVDVYNDAGHSGKDLMRPEMQRLLKDIKDIEKAIEKLKMQEKKLIDLYLSSNLNIETINNKNDIIKKEIANLNKKKQRIYPNNDYKEYTIELLKKLDCDIKDNEVMLKNKIGFAFIFDSLNRKSKKELIKRLIDTIEIKREKNYNIEITNIKFTEEFISKSSKDYIEYLYEILQNNNVGFIYKEAITKQELEKLQEDYFVFSNNKIANNEYDNATLTIYNELLKQNFYDNGIINCPYIDNENIVDYLTLF